MSELVGVFARADHPDGYGFGKVAHGYSVLLVEVSGGEELQRVREVLAYRGVRLPCGVIRDDWYGGKFDLLATVSGEARLRRLDGQVPVDANLRRNSIGDNRFCGIYTAAEIMDLLVEEDR